MTSSREPPASADDTPQPGAPPTQPTPGQSSGVVPEPPESSAPPGEGEEQHDAGNQPRTKPEGSSYASSYRPSDASANPPPVSSANANYGYNTGQIDTSAEDDRPDHPPPAYTEVPGQISDESTDLGTNAVVADDGRVNIRINQKTRRFSQFITPQIHQHVSQAEQEPAPPPPYVPEFLGGAPGREPPPPLNVVIHVVGSRGDVQPFVALGKVLKETYKHRVRLATHGTFKDFVIENGLEFFSIGGDPAELMAFMVKNPGLMPGFETLRSGDVGSRRKGIAEILRGTWRSCIETGNGLGVDPLKQSVEEWMGVEDELPEAIKKPFVADAIIANPPSFGHIHCAEKLGIPLHMMFTMPWSPTQQFPHPLANIQSSNADASITNFMSYTLVDMLTWQGLGDVINKFRKDSLGLDDISMIWAPGMLARMKIPYTYCWSPALIPKPKDWGHHISISGFFFLNLASNYTPPPDLAEFLAAGEPPVYIGFGSIVVDDPNAMTKMIFEAVKITGRRALVSKGWGGLGADELGIPEGVFMLGNCPHDWLFKHVACVVHHGGAGTTAAGIAAGRPTVVVPFFGDQPFWGAMTAKAGAGPFPVPYKDLTAEKLAENINEALKPESLERAQELSVKISKESGGQVGAQSFHQMLKYDDLRCAVAPSHPAVWRVKRTQVRLSAMAATVLCQEGELTFAELKLFRPREYETDEGPWDPITGGATAIIGTATTMMMGVADFPIETLKLLSIHPDASKKGKAKEGQSQSRSDSGDTTRTGRTRDVEPEDSRKASAASSATTLPGVTTPGVGASSSTATETLIDSSGSVTPRESSSGEHPQVTSPTTRGTFMAQAMAESSQVSRSRSRSRDRFCPLPERVHTASPLARGHSRSSSSADTRFDLSTTSTFSDRFHGMNAEAAVGTGKGLGRIVGAGFKSPMEFSLNVAKGFHNVPKLYGDEVRQVDKVTDLQSGVKTAVKELGLGFYGGITGLVTDPLKGAKKEGVAGFIKGVGRGIAGVPLKVMGGVFSVPAYAMKGLYQEALKNKGANVQNYIIAARISQGYEEASEVPAELRADILSRWKCIQLNVKKKKNPGEDQIDSIQVFMKERRKKRQDRWEQLKNGSHFKTRPEARPSFPAAMSDGSSYSDLPEATDGHRPLSSRNTTRDFSRPVEAQTGAPLQHATTFPSPQVSREELALQQAEEEAERRELDQAIAASISETSRGNQEEDEMIARAIRASVAEFERAGPTDDDEEALERALNASISEASKSGATEEEQKMLEETLRKSLLDTHARSKRAHGSDSEWDSDSDMDDDEEYQRIIAESKELAHLQQTSPQEYGVTTADAQHDVHDEELKRALEESQKVAHPPAHAGHSEEELQKALEESQRAETDRMSLLEKQKTEEDVVMEYVKKQSLAEEEHRRRMLQGRGGEERVGESSRGGAGPA
ncbi:UDP-Glycosyltransferase/glycogen phosphorylase [Polyplosphaeria fusca]|uniref:UDP-Glycosyltransferase/glycogen phosphorylase n=1 Tax=Polyplosphaeria fusca TaxID=682080 RepID=A0A9P4QRX1_9PLEO|nr:UDP-Glycosyltransferase/glycogen phosphorylase [Polyplosphaeria fusca]